MFFIDLKGNQELRASFTQMKFLGHQNTNTDKMILLIVFLIIYIYIYIYTRCVCLYKLIYFFISNMYKKR